MINSLFIINRSGYVDERAEHSHSTSDPCSDIVLEKHWKSVIHRSLCDYFFDAQKRVLLGALFARARARACRLRRHRRPRMCRR